MTNLASLDRHHAPPLPSPSLGTGRAGSEWVGPAAQSHLHPLPDPGRLALIKSTYLYFPIRE